VAHVLLVGAFELRHPVALLIPVVADDPAPHRRGLRCFYFAPLPRRKIRSRWSRGAAALVGQCERRRRGEEEVTDVRVEALRSAFSSSPRPRMPTRRWSRR